MTKDPRDVGCKYKWLWNEGKVQHEKKNGEGCPEYGKENIGELENERKDTQTKD